VHRIDHDDALEHDDPHNGDVADHCELRMTQDPKNIRFRAGASLSSADMRVRTHRDNRWADYQEHGDDSH
jgi:hypothetical protein